jgi:hypothetical protein
MFEVTQVEAGVNSEQCYMGCYPVKVGFTKGKARVRKVLIKLGSVLAWN